MRVLASVGTDHHRFDRLMGWLDDWYSQRGEAVEMLVQRGTSTPPAVVDSVELMTPEDLDEWMQTADVVVCHGGPSTIMEARAHGHRPLVVARDPALGEHVDGHQQRFAAHLAARSVVEQINTAADLERALDAARRDPGRWRLSPEEAGDETVARTVDHIGHLIDQLLVDQPARSAA